MRIVAGRYKGITLKSPQWETTRPMTDKVRGAVFNVLGDIGGSRVLDMYAGTGAVGLEALSRGALHTTFVDADPRCTALITQNLGKARAEADARVMTVRAEQYLNMPRSSASHGFDLVFFTPPYAIFDFAQVGQLVPFLADNATVVAEKDAYRETSPVEPPGLALWSHKKYGGTEVLFYVKT
jgi:16S rRNA (guanine966-N2)-methyltransferase